MASYSASRCVHKTAVVGIVDTVTITSSCPHMTITNRHATSDIYVRFDGVDPAALGDNCFVVLANSSKPFETPDASNAVVRIVATVAAPYSVECQP